MNEKSEVTTLNVQTDWWSEEYGFFGEHYLEGDNSNDGYLIGKKQNLQERTNTEVDGVVKLLKLNPGDSILDMPCGYGRHSIELARRGYKVTGVDINEVHLSKARKNSLKENVQINFKKENMISINYHEKFNVSINLFYSFGFFHTDEENMQTLRNFYNSLEKGGRFLMHTDVNIPRILNGKYKENELRELVSNNQLRIIDVYNAETKRIDGAWIIRKSDGSEVSREYSVRVYTKEEFTEMCYEVGFKKCETYSNWEGSPYNPDSEDMIVVAYK